jgi:uncharacterized protein (TIGR00251 family)
MGAPGPISVEPDPSGRGTRLRVRAQPGARRSGVVGTWNGHLKVALRAPPQDGRANEELLTLVAEVLGLRRHQVRLVRGERARLKELALEAPVDLVRERLLGLLGPGR